MIGGIFTIECWEKKELLWLKKGHNLVVNAGLDYLLQTGSLLGGTWYIGLTGATPAFAPGDTMGVHGGWTEVQAYTQANRVTWSGVRISTGLADNSAAPATFNINADGTIIGGVFLTSSNVKGGVAGTLFSGFPFADGNVSLNNTQALVIKYPVGDVDDGV